MAEDNSTMMEFDRVYDSRFVEKDTEDHFDGMLMGSDAAYEAQEARRARKLAAYHEAKAKHEAELAGPETSHVRRRPPRI